MGCNNLGTYANVAAVWAAYPEGGQVGDYVIVNGSNLDWNPAINNWGGTPGGSTPAIQGNTVSGDLTITHDLHVSGNIHGNIDYMINAKKGVANGIAPLDSTGKVPSANLPEISIPSTGLTSVGVAFAQAMGFNVTGSPLTQNGTINVSLASGREIPETNRIIHNDGGSTSVRSIVVCTEYPATEAPNTLYIKLAGS